MRRVTILAMALAAVAALALPSAASAAWKHGHQQAIQQDAQIGFTGTGVKFQSAIGGIECQITSRAKFTSTPSENTTGHVETFVPHPTSDTANCKGTGGLAFCQVHNLTPQAPTGWVIHTIPNTTTVSITFTKIDSTVTGGFCPLEWVEVTPGEAIGTSQTHTISSLSLSGNIQVDVQTKAALIKHPNGEETHQRQGQIDNLAATVSGTLDVEAPNANTYSI